MVRRPGEDRNPGGWNAQVLFAPRGPSLRWGGGKQE